MGFGTVTFDTTHNGNLQLGTNGILQITGIGMTSGNDAQAGHVVITSPDTGLIEVKCETTGKLADPPATTLDIINTEIVLDTPQPFGSGDPCQGTKNNDPVVLLIDLAASVDPDIFIGGEVEVLGPLTFPADRSYETTGGGGAKPIVLSIVVQ